MVWFRTDDGFPEHPKCDALAEHYGDDWAGLNLAFATWHLMGCDCAARLTDGVFTATRAYRIMRAPREHIDGALMALVKVGLLAKKRDGYAFHDWHDYQPTREHIEAERKSKRERQARWRAGKTVKVDGAVDASTDVSTRASRDASVTPTVEGAPSRPVPSRTQPQERDTHTPRAHADVRECAREADPEPAHEEQPPSPDEPPAPPVDGPPSLDHLDAFVGAADGGVVPPDPMAALALDRALVAAGMTVADCAAFGRCLADATGRRLAWPTMRSPDSPVTARYLGHYSALHGEQPYQTLRAGIAAWRHRVAKLAAAAKGRPSTATAAPLDVPASGIAVPDAPVTEGPLVDLRALVAPNVATLVGGATLEREATEQLSRYKLTPVEMRRVGALLSRVATWWPTSGATKREAPSHVTLTDLAGYRDRETRAHEWKPLDALIAKARGEIATEARLKRAAEEEKIADEARAAERAKHIAQLPPTAGKPAGYRLARMRYDHHGEMTVAQIMLIADDDDFAVEKVNATEIIRDLARAQIERRAAERAATVTATPSTEYPA